MSCSNLGCSGPCCFQGFCPCPPAGCTSTPTQQRPRGFWGRWRASSPRRGPELQKALARQERPGHRQAFCTHGRNRTCKPPDTNRFSCFSQRWKLYRNTAEMTRTCVSIKHSSGPCPSPVMDKNQAERGLAGAVYVQRAGQDPRGPPGKSGQGLRPPPPSRGGAPTLCAAHSQPHRQPLDTTCPEGQRADPAVRPSGAVQLGAAGLGLDTLGSSLGKSTLGLRPPHPCGGLGSPVGPELTPRAAGRGGLAAPG